MNSYAIKSAAKLYKIQTHRKIFYESNTVNFKTDEKSYKEEIKHYKTVFAINSTPFYFKRFINVMLSCVIRYTMINK